MESSSIMQSWTDAERWAWDKLSAGQPANFGVYDGQIDPPSGMATIRPEFLSDILLTELAAGLSKMGVIIVGANFTDTVDLSYASIDHLLVLDSCVFASDILLLGFKSSKDVSFRGCIVEGMLEIEGGHIGGLLVLSYGRYSKAINLRRAKIDGQLDIVQSEVNDQLQFDNLQVKGLLTLQASQVRDIALNGASVGQLYLRSIQCSGSVSLDGIQVSQNILMGGMGLTAGASEVGESELWMFDEMKKAPSVTKPSRYHSIVLNEAKVGGQIDLTGAIVTDRLVLDSTKIGGHLLLRCGDFNIVDLSSAKINNMLDLRYTQIKGELDLSGLRVDSFKDANFDWPAKLKLERFEYNHLYQDSVQRPASWFVNWLGASPYYTPQPYRQAANVLTAAGYKDKADAVLYAGRCQEWSQVGWRRRLWIFLLWIFIGFGYKTHRALFWIIGLSLTGVFILDTGNASNLTADFAMRFFFALDTLLPIVKLDPSHDKIALTGWVIYYFYMLKIMGWILGSFLVAGLSGLTKK